MGLFAVRVEVFSNREPPKSRVVEFIVDTGATLSVIPEEIAQELGVQPEEMRIFQLADGTRVSRDLGTACFAYEGRRTTVPVVIGRRGDIPLLGAITMEALGYEADPVHRTLRPSPMYLLHAGTRLREATPTST